MTDEERNQYINQYIRNMALQVNSQYGTEVIDKDKIARAIKIFKDSSQNLENEIIPKINELTKQIINEFVEFKKQIEEMLKKRQEEQLSELATLDLNTDKNGIYLSQQQVDLLMIVNINSLQELKNYVENLCGQFPHMKVEDIIPNFDMIFSQDQLEEAKRTLYQRYQDGLISYLDNALMKDTDKARVKLQRFGINGQELEMCLSQISQGRKNEIFGYLGQKYGDNFIKSFNRVMNDDFENIKGISYDEMKSLSELIKRDQTIDTIIIATGKFNNTIYPTISGRTFDPYLINKSAEYCSMNGKHMRYHALFDHSHVDALINKYIKLNGRTIDQLSVEEIALLHSHKEEILTELNSFVKLSMDNINALNFMHPGLIREVEVFNELVEKNKKDKISPYAMVWEKYFGISINDIMNCFPKNKDGKFIKPDGVEFMYNETTLTESTQKRAVVERVLYQIEQIQPGFIDLFGDQMHLSDEDIMTNNGLRNLTETAQLLKRIQDGRLVIDGHEQAIRSKRTECTEHDFHFTIPFLEMADKVKQSGQKIDLWSIKRGMQSVISSTYRENGVNFERSTYWSLMGKNDHNIVRNNISIQRENKQRRKNGLEEKPLLETMFAGLIPEGKNFSDINSLKSGNRQHVVQRKPKIEDSFARRSQTEVEIYNKIKKRNQMIKQRKLENKQLNNQNVKKLVKRASNDNGNNNQGHISIFTLTLIIGFLVVMLLMIVFMLIM